MQKKIYIIGGGIAGLSSAFFALKKGYKVEIFESTKHLGGRCRSYFDKKLNVEIDNGNHLVLNSNKNVIEVLKELKIKHNFFSPEKIGFNFYNAKSKESYFYKPYISGLPEIPLIEKLKFFKFIITNQKNKTVEESFSKMPLLFSSLIKNVSTSILNTAPHKANAEILRQVLKKILKYRKSGFKYLYPIKNWNEDLINPLEKKILEMKGVINKSKRLTSFEILDKKICSLNFNHKKIELTEKDYVIFCGDAKSANKIFNISIPKKYNPILNVHFLTNQENGNGIIGINDSKIEWVFKKGKVISTTTSDYNPLTNSNIEEIVTEVWEIILNSLKLKNSILKDYKVIIEKRATFSCEIEELKKRPDNNFFHNKNETGITVKNLFIAGDYTNTGLPATIEGAVKSAKSVMAWFE